MDHNKLNIRAYTETDQQTVLQLLKSNIPKYFAANELKDFERYLNQELDHYYVVEINDEIVGCGGINFENSQTIAKISWDLIAPQYQQQGIGTQLLQYRLAYIKSIKTVKSLRVRTSQLAYPFYEKNGFVLKDIHKNYWAKGFDLYTMIYPLS
jgi:ribosomal-protein-alanine N-acetyltransferase